jgi:hypothetical protein
MWEPSKDVSDCEMAVAARECSRRLQVSYQDNACWKTQSPLFSEYFILTLDIYETEFVIG